ncbi:hypothetical protein PILCRDRAFT_812406 [Piloderma croceum F 1598]|uniref:Uncharacterized protein n=1 Tax=Piloderma croceum (strain F 1598) TaxID=765440 RepID=A0A0C3GG04_PILCF|nr:hypothetical protein PILCRDRAFT_812406 [Piloderma croceum F 1598]
MAKPSGNLFRGRQSLCNLDSGKVHAEKRGPSHGINRLRVYGAAQPVLEIRSRY